MTTQVDSELQMVNISIEQAQKGIDRRESMYRLMKNRDFKALFLKGYIEDEAIRLVELLSHPGQQDEESQKLILHNMIGIGQIKQYMNMVRVDGDMKERAMGDHEEMAVHLRERMVNDDG